MCLCHGVLVKKEASVKRIQIRHTMWRNGGTIYLTFVFVNKENIQTVMMRQCNNVAPPTRTMKCEWLLKQCNNSDGEDKIVINKK